MTDSDFLLHMLRDGDWKSLDTIVANSQLMRGHGLTVHSRAADLRKRGHDIETRQERTPLGRVRSFYRLVTLDEPRVVRDDWGSSSVPATDGAEEASTVPLPVEPAGALQLFACEIDESAGLRGAYHGEAA